MLAQFPPALRALVDGELAAGNSVVEVSYDHPATPVGACLKLSQRVSTRPRATSDELRFRERNGSSHCGEFTDVAEHYFVLEAPDARARQKSMEEIRAELAERERRSDEERFRELYW